ncbi:MAG: hypothetical protein ABTD50_13000 [Polyangiaceae bacterium]
MSSIHQSDRSRHSASRACAALTALAIGGLLPSTAHAEGPYLYAQAAPPPPPPNGYGPAGPPPPPPYGYGPPPPYVYGPPPPPRYRYSRYDPEPPYAFVLAVDFEGAIPVNAPQLGGNTLTGGGGIKLRFGEQIRLQGGVRITPELGYGYDHLFASDDAGDAYSWDFHRLFGGARLSFGRFLVPVIYGHIGYGWRVTGDPSVPQEGGLALDVGGALDLRVIPHFGIGVHIEYATIDAQDYAPQWIATGLHADLTF